MKADPKPIKKEKKKFGWTTKKSQSSELSKARTKADKMLSEYVRRRDADENGIVKCCTCGVHHHWKEVDCGHFQSRRYEATRFDEKNTGPQCKYCNRYNQGEQFKFGLYLEGKYGRRTAEKITVKSRMFSKRTRYDYEVIAQEYKDKIAKL